MTIQVNDLYTAILSSLGYEVLADGMVMIDADNAQQVVRVDGKALYLATDDILRNADWENVIVFHPCAENAIRNESLIQKRLRGWVTTNLFYKIRFALTMLMDLNLDADKHKDFSPAQRSMLQTIAKAGNVTKRHKQKLDTILNKSTSDQQMRLITIFMKKNGILRGQEFRRCAMVQFPFMEQLEGDKKSIFGVALTNPEYEILRALFEYVLPGSGAQENEYSAGSLDTTAPSFEALMLAYANVTNRLNELFRMFHDMDTGAEIFISDLEWVDMLTSENLLRFKAQVPVCPGNEGESTTQRAGAAPGKSAVTTQAGVATPAPAAQPQHWNQVVPANPMVKTAEKVSWSDVKNRTAGTNQNFTAVPQHQNGAAPVQNQQSSYQYAPPPVAPILELTVQSEYNGLLTLRDKAGNEVVMPTWQYDAAMAPYRQPQYAPAPAPYGAQPTAYQYAPAAPYGQPPAQQYAPPQPPYGYGAAPTPPPPAYGVPVGSSPAREHARAKAAARTYQYAQPQYSHHAPAPYGAPQQYAPQPYAPQAYAPAPTQYQPPHPGHARRY